MLTDGVHRLAILPDDLEQQVPAAELDYKITKLRLSGCASADLFLNLTMQSCHRNMGQSAKRSLAGDDRLGVTICAGTENIGQPPCSAHRFQYARCAPSVGLHVKCALDMHCFSRIPTAYLAAWSSLLSRWWIEGNVTTETQMFCRCQMLLCRTRTYIIEEQCNKSSAILST